MITTHCLGYPRIGLKRELKKSLEQYWDKLSPLDELQAVAKNIRHNNQQIQEQSGLDYITVGDFSFYDQVLDHCLLFDVIPKRFNQWQRDNDLALYFALARGYQDDNQDIPPLEMTKWFNTNYHYLVPEFDQEQTFELHSQHYIAQIIEAQKSHQHIKPVLLGPLTFLYLGKEKNTSFNRLDCLPALIEAYCTLFNELQKLNIDWVQIDEPVLTLDLDRNWQAGFTQAYQAFKGFRLKRLLTTYFGSINHHLDLINQLPIDGLHIDTTVDNNRWHDVEKQFSSDKILSLGIIDGRNIWRTDLEQVSEDITKHLQRPKKQCWLAPSCSLLHCPLDVDEEQALPSELKSWLSFAKQKLEELNLLKNILDEKPLDSKLHQARTKQQQAIHSRHNANNLSIEAVQNKCLALKGKNIQRHSPYPQRLARQQQALNLPKLPTTTIGSFPQTQAIRLNRRNYKKGDISLSTYESNLKQEIKYVIKEQEDIGLDVLVHGEAERNDMVEYFAEYFSGFAFTKNGWVQSYGSRCVKPPIIYGDVARQSPISVKWSQFANELTKKPVKGMLTGPVTIFAWSFVRDDIAPVDVCEQIALALNDEVLDLERAGIQIIQVDEPAFRESLPLREKDWPQYLEWSARCFRLATANIKDETQIHTHMCYSEFNDIIEAIISLDADVISLEASRSDMALLKAFKDYAYPNSIGPGVYDIHSPIIPNEKSMRDKLEQALQYINATALWVNPDCGLKTRKWHEVKPALTALVGAAKKVRESIG